MAGHRDGFPNDHYSVVLEIVRNNWGGRAFIFILVADTPYTPRLSKVPSNLTQKNSPHCSQADVISTIFLPLVILCAVNYRILDRARNGSYFQRIQIYVNTHAIGT